MGPCREQGKRNSGLARESRLEISLVKERSNAVVIIASELSLREIGLRCREYFVGYSLLFNLTQHDVDRYPSICYPTGCR